MPDLLRLTVSLTTPGGRTVTSEVGHVRGPDITGMSTLMDLTAEDRHLVAEMVKDFAASLDFDEEVD